MPLLVLPPPISMAPPPRNPLAALELAGIPSRAPSLSPSGRLWPNGEFSQGYRRSPGDERLDMRSLADSWGDERGGGGDTPPIDLVNLPKSHKPKAQRGELGITTYGRKMLRNGVYTLKERLPGHPLTFCTLTVPDLPLAGRRLLAAQWGEVVRQSIQWISRQLARQGVEPLILSCSEIQPSRLQNGGGAYLHLHLVWPNPPKNLGEWGVDAGDLRAWWSKCLRRITDNPSMQVANIDLQVVKGDISRELSKYLSKGSSVLTQAAADLGIENMPRTWWNMSKPLRDAIKSAIIQGHSVGALLLEWIEYDRGLADQGIFQWIREIYAEIEGRDVQIGHTGQLTPALNLEAHSLLVSE